MNNLDFSSGTHLITGATVVGLSALAFTIFPFGIIILRSILKAKENTTSGFSIFGAVLLAFSVHFVFCVLYIAIIKILDIVILDTTNFVSKKLFGIFWANGRNEVLNLVGGGATNDALGAYSTLLLVRTIGDMLLYNLPIAVIIVGFSYGIYQANKDIYRQDYLTILTFTIISFICVWTIYVAWAYVASEALFLPHGKNLFNIIADHWTTILK